MQQKSQQISAREAAEDGIFEAIEGLSVPDALGALAEVQAQVLANQNVVPGTDSFRAFESLSAMLLAGRVRTLYRERVGVDAEEIEDEGEVPAPIERGPAAWWRRAWH